MEYYSAVQIIIIIIIIIIKGLLIHRPPWLNLECFCQIKEPRPQKLKTV